MKGNEWRTLVIIVMIVAGLWFSGIVPEWIARIAGTSYVKKTFPEMQLECINIEYADVYGDYLILFEDKDGNTYGCTIGPALFPIKLGQGLYSMEEYYSNYYS